MSQSHSDPIRMRSFPLILFATFILNNVWEIECGAIPPLEGLLHTRMSREDLLHYFEVEAAEKVEADTYQVVKVER